MKILIVTVYKSSNFGSILQARQLNKAISEYGEVYFLDNKFRKIFSGYFSKVKKYLKTKNIKNIIYGSIFELYERIQFYKNWKRLKSIKKVKDFKISFLGSDEIWNIKRKECQYPKFFGDGIDTFKISYAPSINKAQSDDFENNKKYIEYINNIDNISVRDTHSVNTLSKFINKKIDLVLDPTLLFEPEKIKFNMDKKYIAIYVFEGTLSEEEKKSIIKFAREKNMPLVSAGQYISWCDYNVHSINCNPFYIYENADYVITNTFHGTIYAINHNTNFVSFSATKPKVYTMLEQFELTNRIVDENTNLIKIFDNNINYEKVNNIIEKYRSDSFNFIKKSFDLYEKTKN